MALPKLELRITVPSGGWVASVTDSGGTQDITVPAGDYYLAGTTSIMTTFADACTANATLAGTYTCTVDDTSDSSATGKVTLAASGGGNISVTWTSTSLRDALGFTGNLSGATSHESSSASPYIFLPNCGRTGVLGPEPSSTSYNMGAVESDYRLSVSPSGYTTTLTYNQRYVDTMTFANLKGYKCWKQHETVTNESLQTFIQQMLTDGGSPFKFFPSRTDDTVAFQFAFAEGFNGFRPTPVVDNWVGAQSLWVFSANVRKKI